MALSAIPQVVITVSITGDSSNSSVSYSFTDPHTETPYKNWPSCVLPEIVPAYCIFAMDYASTGKGWTIKGMTATGGTTELTHWLAENGLALTTLVLDPYLHQFTINFYNTVTKDKLSDDPQEGNIPQPVKISDGPA